MSGVVGASGVVATNTGGGGGTGPTGPAGTAGTVLRNGAGAPSNATGVDGDYYLNTTTSDLYLRTGGVYSIVGNFKGSAGAAGVGFRTPSAVSYAATLTLDCSTADTFNVGALTGNITLSFSGAVDGQKILVRLTQDATGGRTVAFGSMVAFGSDIPSITLSTAASKLDVIGLVYSSATSKYNVVSYAKGY